VFVRLWPVVLSGIECRSIDGGSAIGRYVPNETYRYESADRYTED
jgi:hypothetical protein